MKSLIVAAAALLITTLGLATEARSCAMYRARRALVAAAQNYQRAVKAEARGEVRRAIRLYERAMNGRGEVALRADSATRAAALHLSEGHVERAVARLERALEIQPGAAEAHALLARVRAAQGSLPAAKEHLARARELGASARSVMAAERAVRVARPAPEQPPARPLAQLRL